MIMNYELGIMNCLYGVVERDARPPIACRGYCIRRGHYGFVILPHSVEAFLPLPPAPTSPQGLCLFAQPCAVFLVEVWREAVVHHFVIGVEACRLFGGKHLLHYGCGVDGA